MCHTGVPLGGPCKHCSVTALITERGRDTGGGTETLGGGGCDNKGDGGMKTKGQERTWKGEEGGRKAKWKEHDLEKADERAEEEIDSQTRSGGKKNKQTL